MHAGHKGSVEMVASAKTTSSALHGLGKESMSTAGTASGGGGGQSRKQGVTFVAFVAFAAFCFLDAARQGGFVQ
jgi:hypothetical protein